MVFSMRADFQTSWLPPISRVWLPVILIVLVAIAGHSLVLNTGDYDLELSLWLGLVFGVLLQRSRFCFYCVTRDYFERQDARGLLGIVAALAVGTVGYHLVFGAFIPDVGSGRLPPGAHIGPVSWVLVAGACSFGVGMALSGACVSAVLYRIGEGMVTAPLVIVGLLLGFGLGFLSWNTLYLRAMQEAPVVWLPHYLGYGGALALQLALLAGVALYLSFRHRRVNADNVTGAWWQQRWQTWAGGLLIGMLGTVTYLRLAPLGVTAELGSVARTGTQILGLLPQRLEGLDTLRGCATVIKEALWSNNGLFIGGLIVGSWAAAWLAGDIVIRKPALGESVRAVAGGVLMGWGGMVALGCTVGTLLSGIMASALSGWVFAVFCLLGLYLGWRLRQRYSW